MPAERSDLRSRNRQFGAYPDLVLMLFPVGLLMANLSPVSVAVSDGFLRHAVLALGTACLLVVPTMLWYRPPTRKSFVRFTLLFAMICVVEILNFINLGSTPDWLVPAAGRVVVYVYMLAGFSFAATIPARNVRIPWLADAACLVMATGASLLWLRFSSSLGSQGSRFTGSEELHPVGLGLTFGLSTIICFSIMFSSTSKLIRVGIVPACIALLLCVLSTGSRGTLLSLGAVLTLATISKIESVKSLFGVGLAGIGTIAAFIAAAVFVPEIRDQAEFVIERFTLGAQGDVDTSLLIRKEIRSYYFGHVDKWILMGERDYDMSSYPHNVFLELAIRYGVIVGGVVAVGLVLCVLRALVWLMRRPKIRDDSVAFLISLIGLYSFILCQFNLSLEFNRGLWLFVAYWIVRPSESEIVS